MLKKNSYLKYVLYNHQNRNLTQVSQQGKMSEFYNYKDWISYQVITPLSESKYVWAKMNVVHKICKLNNLGHINIDALLFCASGIFSRMKAFFVSNTLAALKFPSFCLGWKLECIDETFLHLIITALLMAVSVNFTCHYIQ